MAEYLNNFWRDETGQDLIEYSLLITFIAIACLSFLGIGRPAVSGIWSSTNNELVQANGLTASGGSS